MECVHFRQTWAREMGRRAREMGGRGDQMDWLLQKDSCDGSIRSLGHECLVRRGLG